MLGLMVSVVLLILGVFIILILCVFLMLIIINGLFKVIFGVLSLLRCEILKLVFNVKLLC